MKFIEIGKSSSVFPGEYVLHKPSSSIVMVGSFNREQNLVRAFRDGRLFEDKIKNFNKIELDHRETGKFKKKTCKKCKGTIR